MAGDESAFSYAREAIDLVGVLSARSIELGGQLGHGGCDVAGVIRPAKKKQQVKSQARAEEVAAVKEGKKPFFQKKSALRERELLTQYEELKKKGQLDKFLEKRRKKLDAKQHRQRMSKHRIGDHGHGCH